MQQAKLILFDMDGTLVENNEIAPMRGVAEWFKKHGNEQHVAIVTNQGGVGLRHWMEAGHFGSPASYPTADEIEARIDRVTEQLNPGMLTLFCYAYQNKKGTWGPTPEGEDDTPVWNHHWRKPAPGMLMTAMEYFGVGNEETLMVGNGEEDRLAAEAAHVAFTWADEFFTGVHHG